MQKTIAQLARSSIEKHHKVVSQFPAESWKDIMADLHDFADEWMASTTQTSRTFTAEKTAIVFVFASNGQTKGGRTDMDPRTDIFFSPREPGVFRVGDTVRILQHRKFAGWTGFIHRIEPDHRKNGDGDLLIVRTHKHDVPMFGNDLEHV